MLPLILNTMICIFCNKYTASLAASIIPATSFKFKMLKNILKDK